MTQAETAGRILLRARTATVANLLLAGRDAAGVALAPSAPSPDQYRAYEALLLSFDPPASTRALLASGRYAVAPSAPAPTAASAQQGAQGTASQAFERPKPSAVQVTQGSASGGAGGSVEAATGAGATGAGAASTATDAGGASAKGATPPWVWGLVLGSVALWFLFRRNAT